MEFVFTSFFVRTDSTTVLGCTPPDPYQAPVEEALPLACQPHLLHPGARREEMFGTVQEQADGERGSSQVNSMALLSSTQQAYSKTEGRQSASAKESKGEDLHRMFSLPTHCLSLKGNISLVFKAKKSKHLKSNTTR